MPSNQSIRGLLRQVLMEMLPLLSAISFLHKQLVLEKYNDHKFYYVLWLLKMDVSLRHVFLTIHMTKAYVLVGKENSS